MPVGLNFGKIPRSDQKIRYQMVQSSSRSTSFVAKISRHDPGLPVYFLVPSDVVKNFGSTETFVVETQINEVAIGRRTVKPWGDSRWFIELNRPQCEKAKVAEGDQVSVRLDATEQEPADLILAMTRHGLKAVWIGLTKAQRRQLGEPVFEARRPATRAKRVERAIQYLLELRDKSSSPGNQDL